MKIGYLTGGLGNQLFQLAANLAFAENSEFILEATLGAPRKNVEGVVDLFEFELPRQAVISNSRRSRFFSKAFSLGIKLSAHERKHSSMRDYLFRLAISIAASVRYKAFLVAKISDGVGYNSIKCEDNYIALGYFQSYKFFENSTVTDKLKGINLKRETPTYLSFKQKIHLAKPLIIHMRLGDYSNEPGIGILPPSYYAKALLSFEELPNLPVWVFSDEIDAAREILEKVLVNREVTWFSGEDLSSAETLSLLRMGSHYIIGNSTFSWWGAYLSFADNPMVACPDPWFTNTQGPLEICPPNWKKIRYRSEIDYNQV